MFSSGGPRQKPVGAPAAHSLVKDSLSLRTPGERDQLRVEVQQNVMMYVVQHERAKFVQTMRFDELCFRLSGTHLKSNTADLGT